MQLPDQLLKKLRLLTDKPISPTVNKQLHPLLLHENLNIDKVVPLLCLKYRCDLLIHLLQNGRYPAEGTINSMLASIITNILQYKIAEVLQLYILVLSKIEEEKKSLQVGYSDLIKPAIKQPNLETKQKLFQIIVSNCQYFYKRKCKKLIMAIVANYLDVFVKFLIYVPSFVSMISLALDIDSNSKKIINKEHPEREPDLEQIFVDLSSKQLSLIANQIMTILQNTKDKLNYYSLHRNCLDGLKKIGQILNKFKIKESEINFTDLTVGQIYRTIELFQDRKGTLDEARFAKAAWNKRLNQLKKIKQLKSQKYINPPQPASLILDPKQVEKPLLIEEVISMANNYRLKYQVAPAQNQEARQSRIVSVENNFLKKGIGVGGGRTYLLNEKHRSVFAGEKMKNKRLYEDIVDKCFSQYQKDLQYKSFVDPKLLNLDGTVVSAYQEAPIEWKVEEPERLQQNRNDVDAQEINSLPIFEQGKKYRVDKGQQLGQKSLSFEDEEVEEINNLIQLAYSYKFS